MSIQKLISFAALTAGLLFAGSQDAQAETTGPDPYSYVYFITPEPNATFPEAPAAVDASIGVYQGTDDSIANVELFVDGVSLGSVECAAGCVFDDIQLEQGVHELVVVADTGSQDQRTVYVAEEPPSETGEDTGEDTGEAEGGSEDESEGESGEDDTEPGEDEAEAGGSGSSDDSAPDGGCEVTDKPGSPWGLLALPALLLVPAFRRRD